MNYTYYIPRKIVDRLQGLLELAVWMYPHFWHIWKCKWSQTGLCNALFNCDISCYTTWMVDKWIWSCHGMMLPGDKRSTQKKPVLEPLPLSQIPHVLAWDWTLLSAVKARSLTASAIARHWRPKRFKIWDCRVTVKLCIFWDMPPGENVPTFRRHTPTL